MQSTRRSSCAKTVSWVIMGVPPRRACLDNRHPRGLFALGQVPARHLLFMTGPHLIIANEVPPMLKEMGCFWVELHTNEQLDADISADGCSTTIHDVSLQDLVAVVDKAEE